MGIFDKILRPLLEGIERNLKNLEDRLQVVRSQIRENDETLCVTRDRLKVTNERFEAIDKKIVDTHIHFEAFGGNFQSFLNLLSESQNDFSTLTLRINALSQMTGEVTRKLQATFKTEEILDHLRRIEDVNKYSIDESDFTLLKQRVDVLIRLMGGR